MNIEPMIHLVAGIMMTVMLIVFAYFINKDKEK